MTAASPPTLSSTSRDQHLDALERATYDVVVIGGGISGAGVAHEAAQRGLSVALVEAGDYAAGTSSRSSKLIHGGLRYLLTGDIPTVRKTARERKVIHKLAPHLAVPRWMVLPCRNRARLIQVRAALTTYEKLGAVASNELHRKWTRTELEHEEPIVRRDAYPFACAYREYVTDDARLVIANLRAAVRHGAIVANHLPVSALVKDGARVTGVVARCAVTKREVTVRGSVVVNAAGPWVEELQRVEDPTVRPVLQLSKGIHVVLPREKLPLQHVWVYDAPDGRNLFAVPRGKVIYLGTTDGHHARGDVWPDITSSEIDYLISPLSRVFDVGALGERDVVGAWAGLRALVAEPGKKLSEVSRRDELFVGAGGMISIAGGKLTGYRGVAARVLDLIAQGLGRKVPEAAEAVSSMPLPGGEFDGNMDGLTAWVQHQFGLGPVVAERLAGLYGAEVGHVLSLGREPVSPGADVLTGEIEWAMRVEGAMTIEDVVYRRTRIGIYEPRVRELVGAIAERMAAAFTWSREEVAEQLRAVRNRLAADLSFKASDAALGAAAQVPLRA
jgi:glycerol-3-phosphate dehydrogenase